MISARVLFGFIFLSCAALLAYAIYVEKVDGLLPCALCMTQRAFYVAAGTTALIALLHRPTATGQRVYAILAAVFAFAGAGFAGRQVWLQHLPEDQVPACGPSLSYMLDTLPLSETFKTLMMGDGNCAEVVWTFLGMSMPTWSLLWFVLLGAAAMTAALTNSANSGGVSD